MEKVAPPLKTMKPEDEACEHLFVNTHSRTPDGRYTVHLPLKSQPPLFSTETRRIALSSLANTHRPFSKDSKLAEAYREFMKAYEELGHMEKVPESQLDNQRAWYIPLHPVVQSSLLNWRKYR